MNCPSCGSQLSPEAKVCPNCGTPTSASSSNSGPSSYDPTVVSYSFSSQPGSSPFYDPTIAGPPPGAPPQTPSTAYGSDPYAPPFTPAGQQNPYAPPGSQNPYSPLPPTPYVSPQTGPQPSYPPSLTPAGWQGQRQPRRFPTGVIVLLIVLAVVLLIGGSGLIYYTAVYQPNLQHAQATATAMAQVTGTTQAQIKATATAAVQDPYTHSGTLTFSDTLSDNSKGHSWDENANCAFMNGTYHAIAPDARFSDYCNANSTDFSNFALEVQMTIIKGDAGGLIFRVENTNPNQYYVCFVRQDGSYILESVNGSDSPTLMHGSSSAINQGLNQANLIAVVAKGNSITLYVNHQSLGSVTDSTYSHGLIGFYAAVYNFPTEVVFSNARVWTL